MELWRDLLIKDFFLVGQEHEEVNKVTEGIEIDHATIWVDDLAEDKLFRPHDVLPNLRIIMHRSNADELLHWYSIIVIQERRAIQLVFETIH